VSLKIYGTLYTERRVNNVSGALKSADSYSSHVTAKGRLSSAEIMSDVTAEVGGCARSVNGKVKFAPALN
jgi:hypothetical protein